MTGRRLERSHHGWRQARIVADMTDRLLAHRHVGVGNPFGEYLDRFVAVMDRDQQARARVGAEIQVITYKEFLPALLGQGALTAYRGYNASVDCFKNAGISGLISPQIICIHNQPFHRSLGFAARMNRL